MCKCQNHFRGDFSPTILLARRRAMKDFLCSLRLVSLPFLLSSCFTCADDFQPENTQKEGQHPPSSAEALTMIQLPPGFRATLFAGDPNVRQPIAMAWDDRGRLWVAESYSYKEWKNKSEDRVLIFADTDNDGEFDDRKIFYAQANHLSGLAVGFGGVWLCDSPNLLFIPDRDRDDVPDGPAEVILDGFTTRAGHNFFNGLEWGPDGWLYGRHGITAPSLVGPPGTPESKRVFMDCSIWRWHPTRHTFELVVRGTTNPWGLDWTAEGELFMSGNVNGHLWHVIPGARYVRMHGQGHVPYTYERIGPCADHLHHQGGWTNSRDGKANDFGGGHSHCGLMIYQGTNWPSAWRGKAFMCNTHGRRINVDRIEPRGSGFTARHERDFMVTKDPWFRGTQIFSGPDGAVFVSDWSDFGECHDNDGVHRSSGRIFKFTYGKDPELPAFDLQLLSNEELVDLLFHDNIWQFKHARRILQERLGQPDQNLSTVIDHLQKVMEDDAGSIPHRLRALWTLASLGRLESISDDAPLPLQVVAVRLGWTPVLTTNVHPRLLAEVASQGQRAASPEKLQDLIRFANTIELDRPLELMIWYAIEPLISSDPGRWAIQPDMQINSSLVTRLIWRRLAENPDNRWSIIVEADDLSIPKLDGILDGLRGKHYVAKPGGWETMKANVLAKESAESNRVEFLTRFARLEKHFPGDVIPTRDLNRLLNNPKRSEEERLAAVETLMRPEVHDSFQILSQFLDDPLLGPTICRGWEKKSDKRIPEILLSRYTNLPDPTKRAALHALAAREKSSHALLDSVRMGRIPRADITPLIARRISAHKDRYVRNKLELLWGKVSSGNHAKKRIATWEKKLTPEVLLAADRKNGAEIFSRRCAACHQLFDQGAGTGKLGPELTGANRDSLYYLLENIIDPNALVPHDYKIAHVTLHDRRLLSGTIQESPNRVEVHVTGHSEILPRAAIKSIRRTDQSMMPPGLLNGLTDAQVRDLIGYLQRGP